ncbi:MAG: phage antirepressor KilAC domain-containing protein [Clostridia bacterium]|jgi:phage antirepressor YoqD-like protein|nr:phage antirepressor KilAC domain-containing protein [Clostridia bacterium]
MNELTNDETMSVQELADSLHVSIMSVHRVLQNTDNLNGTVKVENGKPTKLNEAQCTRIKMELEGHHNISDNTAVKTVSNDMEFFAKSLELQKYATERIAELEKINQEQQQHLSITQPKADVYDAICDSSTLQDLQTVAQTIGITNVFKVLIADGIIKKEWTKDNILFYRPYSDYNDYLVLKDGRPYVVDGVSHVRPRIFVTGKGITWLTKKYEK